MWPYLTLDNVMDSVTLHSSQMFADLALSLRWSPEALSPGMALSPEGTCARLLPLGPGEEDVGGSGGQGTAMGVRDFAAPEVHHWLVRMEQRSLAAGGTPANFLVGVAPPRMDLGRSLGEQGCGIGERVWHGWRACVRVYM